MCYGNQHALISFGFLTPEIVDFLQKIQRIVHNNVVSCRTMKIAFKMIDFIIQKILGTKLVYHLCINYKYIN